MQGFSKFLLYMQEMCGSLLVHPRTLTQLTSLQRLELVTELSPLCLHCTHKTLSCKFKQHMAFKNPESLLCLHQAYDIGCPEALYCLAAVLEPLPDLVCSAAPQQAC